MSETSDSEIKQIVQRVVNQALGFSNPSTEASKPVAAPPAPAPQAAPAHGVQTSERKIVAIGSDHGGFEFKELLKPDISALGFEVVDAGTNSKEAVDYPDFAHLVASLVGSGKAWRGIVIDGAGIGSCIVANKVPGVRAGMAYDLSSAMNSREHNDTNVLTLGAGLTGASLARQIVKTWLTTEFGGGRHSRRIEKITAVEKQYLK
jgi:ribose 5-phosphate isomerase B